MPHKCTRCGSVFEDGASVILSGCPNCGWNKFLYVMPEGSVKEEAEEKIPSGEAKTEKPSPEEFIKDVDEIIGVEHEDAEEEDGDKVESVRILGPGSYELNLDSLLTRREIVMAIRENGSYAVDLPSVFRDRNKKK
jgi:hypothetical protein